MIDLKRGDCLELMKDISDKSIDMILCDLPYGTTRNKWDSVIPLDKLWEQYKRIIKDNGAIVLFSQMPFSSELVHSNLKLFRYEWIWQKDNEQLRNDINYYNKRLQKENQELKKQLEYLRSGEYYNQLRFENEMLQQVVDTNGVPSEVYDYIDCTHRNTELLEENQELKKQLEDYKKLGFKYLQDKNNNLETQQKEFIEYMNKTIEELECDDVDDEEMKGYLIQRIDTFKEILSKYKEIIGV